MHFVSAIFADPDAMDKLIEWKLRNKMLPTILAGYLTEEQKMQRQYTIELRVDFADADKLGPLKQVLQQAARHALATARLISDNPKSTQVAIFSDDFFTGHEEIALMDDAIQQGLDEVHEESGSDGISSELMEAAGGK